MHCIQDTGKFPFVFCVVQANAAEVIQSLRELTSLVKVKERLLKHSTVVLQWTWELLQATCVRIICPHIRHLLRAKAHEPSSGVWRGFWELR